MEEKRKKKVIGSITTYLGNEIPGLHGSKVRILAVLRGALRPNVNVDANDYFINDEEELTRLGGVTAEDCIDVQPIYHNGRQGFVHLDPRAVDLACFKHLAKAR